MRHFFIISLFIGSSAFANIPAFSSLSRDYAHDQIKPIQAENMPRIASQDGLGICYACVAATMMQSENCRATKPAVGCENLPPSELFSQLDLTRIAPPKEGEEILTSRSSYDGLKLDTDTMGGDPHATAIIASLYTSSSGPVYHNAGASYCWDVGAKNRILKDAKNNEYDFCVFEDGSMIDA